MILALLLACPGEKPADSAPEPTETTPSTPAIDVDGDGFSPPEDCDDANLAVNPLADEHCNDVDDDCNGQIDDDPVDMATWYVDLDGDGYGGDDPVISCDPPENAVGIPGDCNDADPAIHPGALEVCDPEDVDEDCDEQVDDADRGVTGQTAWYADGDVDGYGAGTPMVACDPPPDTVDNGTDCDDTNGAIHPAASEVVGNEVDEDCDAGTGP